MEADTVNASLAAVAVEEGPERRVFLSYSCTRDESSKEMKGSKNSRESL
jgi:hypothetical protein